MLNRSAAPAAESLSAPTTTSSTSQGTQRYAVRRPPAASGKQQAEVLRVVEVTARIQQRVTGLVGGQRVLAEQFHTERPAGTDGYCASTPPKLALYMPGAGLTMKPPPHRRPTRPRFSVPITAVDTRYGHFRVRVARCRWLIRPWEIYPPATRHRRGSRSGT